MAETMITYNLLAENDNSNAFYHRIEETGMEFRDYMIEKLEPEIFMFQQFILNNSIEEVRSIEEYGIELVLFALANRWKESYNNEKSNEPVSYERLQNTYFYLEHSGEWKEEIIRFLPWMHFFAGFGRDGWSILWNKLSLVLAWIDKKIISYEEYLPLVDDFLLDRRKDISPRADGAFILRDKAQYFFNMLGAVILNHIYVGDFARAKYCYIFVPGCMVKAKENCKAESKKDGYSCVGCTKDCQVHRITQAYERLGLHVRILYHESEMNQKKTGTDKKIGVIGVACVLSLISGGFKARRLGYIPQCVFLDYCGCKQHWSKEGIVTGLNNYQLLQCANAWISKEM